MKMFNFDRYLTLGIEGKTYKVDVNSAEVIQAVKDITSNTADFCRLSQEEQESENGRNDITQVYMRFLKTILGEDNLKEIFGDMVIDDVDLSDLCIYILNEITKFKKEKMLKYERMLQPTDKRPS